MGRVMRLASQRAVVIFSVSSCCMSHTIKRLFCKLGVSPAVYELDEEPTEREMEKALIKLLGRKPPALAVFVMSLHLGVNLGGTVALASNADDRYDECT